MPVYEYQCVNCGKVQDRWFSMTDKPMELTDPCEGCGKDTVKKSIMSVTGIAGFQYPRPGDSMRRKD